MFRDIKDRDSKSLYSDIELLECTFVNCNLSLNAPPSRRTTIRNVHAKDCTVCVLAGIGPAVFEDVTIENLKTIDILRTEGAVFKHVTFRGTNGRMVILNDHYPSMLEQRIKETNAEAYRIANCRYYETVDWALDISHGKFNELDVRGVPLHLIRRDPESQIVLSRARFNGNEWRSLNVGESNILSLIDVNLNMFKSDQFLLVACSRSVRTFKADLAAINVLRREGLVEPD